MSTLTQVEQLEFRLANTEILAAETQLQNLQLQFQQMSQARDQRVAAKRDLVNKILAAHPDLKFEPLQGFVAKSAEELAPLPVPETVN